MKPSDIWQHERIQHLESELKKRDELLREACEIINDLNYLKYEDYVNFLNTTEIKKIMESK